MGEEEICYFYAMKESKIDKFINEYKTLTLEELEKVTEFNQRLIYR